MCAGNGTVCLVADIKGLNKLRNLISKVKVNVIRKQNILILSVF